MILLSAGNGVALFGFLHGNAEVPQAGNGQIDIGLGFQPGQHANFGIPVQQRQGKQQTGHILGRNVALQFEHAGSQLAVNGKWHGVVVVERDALFGQFPQVRGNGTLGQSALSEKSGVYTQCCCHGNQEPQRRAAFAAIRHSRLRSGIAHAGYGNGAALLPERCPECGEHVHGGGDVTGHIHAGND